MFNPFTPGKKNNSLSFIGGIQPPAMKQQSAGIPLRTLPLPDRFIVPLQQHQGPPAELQVKTGDAVLKGQRLTRGLDRRVPVHAPTSGIIRAIAPHATAHPEGLAALCVHIEPDGDDRACAPDPIKDYRLLDALQLLELIHLAGIVGLGGAGFPTATKLLSGLGKTDTLIINAAESEPYVTTDDRLMREHADEIVQGILILIHLLNPRQTVIGIEEDKPQAITALRQALTQYHHISLRVLPRKYPSGGAGQLTRLLTGQEIPFDKHAAAMGVLMQNIATVLAIKRAVINAQPLIERVVTLTGHGLASPGNVWARVGTPVSHLLKAAGFTPLPRQRLIMGGPLMGFPLPSVDIPVVKTSNCLLVIQPPETDMDEQPCIRCGLCTDVCPVGLLPQQLYWFSKGAEHEKARSHHLFDCVECGACAWICPSHIPLVQYYRQEKAQIRTHDQENAHAAAAKARFEARKQRLEREKKRREERYQTPLRVTGSAKQNAVSNDQYMGNQTDSKTLTHPEAPAGITASVSTTQPIKPEKPQQCTQDPHTDPYKAAVAAAIARIQAKKTVQLAKK